jgi:hypothetical protein
VLVPTLVADDIVVMATLGVHKVRGTRLAAGNFGVATI